MDKVIFLDVDGVLNVMSDSYRTFMKPYGQHIEPHLVERLNYLIKKTDAYVVVSSSWRVHMDDLEKQMVEQGFKYWDKVIGATAYDGKYRGEQIADWISANKFEGIYCVLEDEPSDICGNKCRAIGARYVVHIDMNEGLSQNDIDRALGILGV
tara:strand:+ start:1790 stop:2248 length:459 start_codon:yes stop_codon:yes gene_type:complete